MRRIVLALALVFLGVSAASAQTTAVEPAEPLTAPVATRTQADCAGFIANPGVPRDLFVVGGADDDFHSAVRQLVDGESVFISHRKGEAFTVGAEYYVVRPGKELFTTWHYPHQGSNVRKLGKPYEDVGQVRVTHVTPAGTVALVTFSCGAIVPGDLLIPFQPRATPEYTVSKPLDHFAPLDSNRQHGQITASRNNYGSFGAETVVYLNLGESVGTKPGQRFRIYKVLPPHPTGSLGKESTPPETIGELVVLSVQKDSCAAMVVSSYRAIAAGDYVEAE